MSLDLRFRSKAAKPIPILSHLVEGLREELVSTAVGGTVTHPVVTLQRFSETRRLIDRAIGQAPTQREREMDQIERRAHDADPSPTPDKAPAVRPSGAAPPR